MMEDKILNDENVFPDTQILNAALGDSFPVYEELIGRLSRDDFGIALEWRYYRDGKSWLGKATHKKKTVFWLDVRDTAFMVTFYFTEKTAEGIMALDIDKGLKDAFRNNRTIGKLLPLSVLVSRTEQEADVTRLAEYKIQL